MNREAAAGAESAPMSLLGRFVSGIDTRLRRAQQVFEYSDRPDCTFRIRRTTSRSSYVLSDGTVVRKGDPIVELHLWNEQLPKLERKNGSIGFGSRLSHGFRDSLAELSAYLDARPQFDDVKVVYANMALGDAGRTSELVVRMCRNLGLEPVHDGHRPGLGEHLHRLGENILSLMTAAVTNPPAARLGMLLRSRAQIAMSRDELRRRRSRSQAHR